MASRKSGSKGKTANQSARRQSSKVDITFLVGGEMGERIRAFDWSKTPLGPIQSWSPALRTMLRILLANRFPHVLWWGPHYIQFYNDPYRPIPGAKHPDKALGRPARECWAEIWHVIGPLIDRPFNDGPATWDDDLFLEIHRHGFVEETHFTLAYSPAPDETAPNGIGGVLATVHEITGKVVGERRVVALRDLGARVAEAKAAEEACVIAAETLARHDKDIPFVLLYLIDPSGGHVYLAGAAGVRMGEEISPLTVELNEAQSGWPLAEAKRTGAMQIVERLGERFAAVPPGPWSDPPNTAVVVPIPSNKAHEPAGLMVAGVSARLKFDQLYQDFFELVRTQVATAIANARAYEEEKKRAEALAEIDRAKTAFFSNVSHEFRTPLTLILGPLEDALASGDHPLPPPQREQLEVVQRNSLRLLKLVNTLLDFSRIEAGRLQANYEPVDLASYTAELASVFRSAIEKAGLRLVVNCPALPEPVYIDKEMWEKIVLNLLSNAFKFTFEGEITVALHWAGDHVELKVHDTGTGIPEHELPNLFKRFHRIRGARARTHEGSGIGLALIQELVRLHSGNVKVESLKSKGTTFTISIPSGVAHLPVDRIGAARTAASIALGAEPYVEEALRWLPEEDSGQLPVTSSQSSVIREQWPVMDGEEQWTTDNARILLADDNADMRQYVQRLLSAKYQVVTVADGLAALQACREQVPDVVLTDVMMPGLDGFELLRELRTDAATREIPIILLSARAGEESRVEGLQAGADDYLIKPFSARELMARVGTHLEMARLRREAMQQVRESQHRFSSIFQATPLAMMLASLPEGRYVEVNDTFIQLVGFSREEAIGKTSLELGLLQNAEKREHILAELQTLGYVRQVEMQVSNKSGKPLWVSANIDIVEVGGQKYALNVLEDITKRKEAENRLALLAEISEGIRNFEDANKLLYAISKAVGEHLQVRRCLFNETDLENDREIVHRDYYNGVESVAGVHRISDYSSITSAEMKAGKTVVNFDAKVDERTAQDYERTYALNGERAYVAVPLMRENCWVATLWVSDDVPRQWSKEEVSLLETVAERTWVAIEKLRIDAALRESEERFRQAADAANALVYEVDLLSGDRAVVYGMERVVGYDPQTTNTTSGWWHSLIHPEDLPAHLAQLDENLKRGGAYVTEYRVRHKSGAWMIVQDNGLIIQENGTAIRMVGAITNITGRKQTAEALRQLNETLELRVEERTAALVESERQVRRVASMLTMAEQEERRRISQVLHDDLQQQLFAIQMHLKFAQQDAETDDRAAMLKKVTEAEQWLRQGIETTRRLTVDLSPPILKSEGLVDMLGWLLPQMKEMHGLEVALVAEHAFHMPDEDMRVLLFQIVRELLFNVVKHAGSDRATVELHGADGGLVIHVTDEGRGFDVSQVAARTEHEGGFGLFSVRERLGLFGGRMEIESVPGAGTRVTIHIPTRLEEPPGPTTTGPTRRAIL